jgi:hypothetical protein
MLLPTKHEGFRRSTSTIQIKNPVFIFYVLFNKIIKSLIQRQTSNIEHCLHHSFTTEKTQDTSFYTTTQPLNTALRCVKIL